MTDKTPGREKLRAITDDTHRLGTDADGNDHYCDMVRDLVWVENAQGDLGGIQRVPSIRNYVEHVDELAGWEEHTYDARSMAEWFDDLVAELEFTPASEVA